MVLILSELDPCLSASTMIDFPPERLGTTWHMQNLYRTTILVV